MPCLHLPVLPDTKTSVCLQARRDYRVGGSSSALKKKGFHVCLGKIAKTEKISRLFGGKKSSYHTKKKPLVNPNNNQPCLDAIVGCAGEQEGDPADAPQEGGG